MRLIVGLGNIGARYENTRHNLGFLVLDALIKKFEPLDRTFWDEDKKEKVATKKIRIGKEDFLLVKPLTFMNNSGFAVAKVANFYKVKTDDIYLIHDDLDFPLGKIRVRFGGGAGGHNGVESVIERLGSDKFLRIRLGIGSPTKNQKSKIKKQKLEDYVLAPFDSGERSKVKSVVKEAIKTIELISEHGIDKYMSKYNG